MRRRLQAWEVERMRLKAWQRQRRAADRRPGVEPDPRFVPSVGRFLAGRLAVQEAERCGCLPAGRFPGRDFHGRPL